MDRTHDFTVQDILALDTFDGAWAPAYAFSPDGGRLAFVVQRAAAHGVRHQRPFLLGNDRGELWLADLALRTVRPLAADVAGGLGFYAPAWSPDGRALAAAMIDEAGIRPVVLDAATGRRTVLLDRNVAMRFGAPPCLWPDPDHVLCAVLPEGVLPLAADTETRAPHRAAGEWAKARAGRAPTADILDVVPGAPRGPTYLDPEPAFLVASLSGGPAIPLREDAVTPEIEAFRHSFARIPLEKPKGPSPQAFPAWAEAVPLPRGARLVAVHEATGRIAYLVEDEDGSRLGASVRDGAPKAPLFETNTHLRQVRLGTVCDLDYATADGTRLTARLLLPPGHEAGERKPAVVWVYPYAKPGPVVRVPFKLNDPSPFNLHPLAAQGFAVIQPSIPIPEGEEPLDVMALLAPAVLPAIEAAVAAGHVDPDRVHVIGQSFGGFAVMAMLATTDAFRSGITMAGFCDLASFHGAGDVRYRYGDPAHLLFGAASFLEGACRLGGPPWHDPDRYARNSPLFHVETIRAPLLIMQGDQDYVPMAQGEEMFTALRKLDRRVRFVRYWGEGHVLSSPANIAHMWEQIVMWLAEVDHSTDPAGTGERQVR
jgi:dipeptidyl aminopeptidase/acylaminoacyl peptidase